MSFLTGLLGLDAGDATKAAAGKNVKAYDNYYNRAQGNISIGQQASSDAINKAADAYNPYTTLGTSATNMYGNALGLNGADGNTAATSAYQTSPGYQFQLDQGTQSALRGASAAGMLNSGNTLTALTQYGQGLANKDYGSWLDRLSGASSQGLTATNGQASQYDNLASLYQNIVGNRNDIEGNYVSGITGANNQFASGQEANKSAQSGFFGNLVGGATKVAGLF